MSRAATVRPKADRKVPEDYLEMVREFPLRPLRTAGEHKSAQAILDRLIGREDLTPGQQDYLEALVRFVEDYEQEHFAGQLGRLTPLDVLRHLMEENDMTTSDLAAVLGSRGLASEVLNGKRGLSKRLIGKLSRRFSVDPAVFLDVESNS